MLLSPVFATAQSTWPSPLKSPVTTAVGMKPAGSVGLKLKPGRGEGGAELCVTAPRTEDGRAAEEAKPARFRVKRARESPKLPAGALVGEMDVIDGVGATTARDAPGDVPPPGGGLMTLIWSVPTFLRKLAGTSICNSVLLT